MVNKQFQEEIKQEQGKYCCSEQDQDEVKSVGKNILGKKHAKYIKRHF